MLLAFVVLDEKPTLIQVAGAVAVCVGVLVASRSAPAPRGLSPRPAEAPPAQPGQPVPPDEPASRLSPLSP
jgi:hypothetical protein